MKIRTKEVENQVKNRTEGAKRDPTMLQRVLKWFDPEHQYRKVVQRFLRLELDVIHRDRHFVGRNLTVIQVKLLDHSTHQHRTEYVIARSHKGNWVEILIDFDQGVRRILSVSTMQEANVELELRDDPDIYQQHFGSVDTI